jgi:peptide deformylase
MVFRLTGKVLDGRHREIVRLGHPVLRQRSEAVPEERFGTRALRDLGRDLLRTMKEDSGVGLAAPQIAVPLRVFAYYVPGDEDDVEVAPHVVVNPVLEFQGEPVDLGWEGCLSIPGLRGMVPRYPGLRLTGRTVDGNPLEIQAEDFHARVIQHEFDHLDGVVFLDRMVDMRSLAFEEEWDRHGEKHPGDREV